MGVPGAKGFEGVDRDERGLREVPVWEVAGLIFVSADPDAEFDIDAHIGGMKEDFLEWGLDKVHYLGTKTLETPTNWKLALDTYTESYHFAALHKDTIAQMSHTDLMAYDRFGLHHRLCFPMLNLADLRDIPKDQWEPLKHYNFVYYLFPNISLFVTNDTVEIFRICPGESVGESKTYHSFFTFAPLETDEQKQAMEETFTFIHSVVEEEDYPVGIGIQKGLSSKAQDTIVFGRNEPTLINMHKQYIEIADQEPTAKAAE